MTIATKNRIIDSVNFALILLISFLCLAPFLHILAISLSSNNPIMSGKVLLWPIEVSFEAYSKVFEDQSMYRSMVFTVALTLLYTLISMAMTIAAAYPLMRTDLRGRKLFMFIIVVTMFFSGGIIPEYILIKNLHLTNSMWSLILPVMINPFYLIIMITFFQSIPRSLEESAEMDGCSHIGTLSKIIVPLSLPVIATLSLFYAVNRWNGFMDSLFYITSPEYYPLQLKLYQLIVNNMANDLLQMEGTRMVQLLPESLKAASVMFATVPILLVYPWLQRYFVSGIMLGAVKG
ncbi:carbohydrate ABC transporter permease [Paenibacillus xerothermodurans]|uniref:Carbohydrate ABC transporter permease n=1 Tax=Paenibacillus xerothermodurans TaxID=1977292 RepID=A0A2W1NCG2_PAEXE|nr:carbohydrate ABC transporter permease [Paenibacillus xerothermodurans]PZE21654.1 carbohydrate ABC transporter permease [Paenibacillus xerothermodurans]